MNQSQPQSSHPKGKEAMATGQPSYQKPSNNLNSYKPRVKPTYAFKDEQTIIFFHLLNRKGMLKLPKIRKPEETRKTDDPRYCFYH